MKHNMRDRQKPSQELIDKQVAMLKEASHVAIVDLEATCTDDPELRPTFVNDTIEVGLVIWDRLNNQFHRHQIYMKPTVSFITGFCVKLTGISKETLKDAGTFSEGMVEVSKILSQYPDITVWGSYGFYDKKQITNQCIREGVDNSFKNLHHINIKDLAWVLSDNPKPLGLGGMVSKLNMKFEGNQHCGVDDAYNIAKVLEKLLND